MGGDGWESRECVVASARVTACDLFFFLRRVFNFIFFHRRRRHVTHTHNFLSFLVTKSSFKSGFWARLEKLRTEQDKINIAFIETGLVFRSRLSGRHESRWPAPLVPCFLFFLVFLYVMTRPSSEVPSCILSCARNLKRHGFVFTQSPCRIFGRGQFVCCFVPKFCRVSCAAVLIMSCSNNFGQDCG